MPSSGPPPPCTHRSLVIRTGTCRPYRRTGKAARAGGAMDTGTTPQVPGCEGGHAANDARPRPGDRGWSPRAPGNDSVSGRAEGAAGQARSPRGSSYREDRLGTQGRGKEPGCRHGARRRWGGPMAIRLGTERKKSGTSSEPSPVHPNRRRRRGCTAGTIKSGGRRGGGRPGAQSKPTTAHPERPERPARRWSPQDRQRR
jgi:hypothetical protein